MSREIKFRIRDGDKFYYSSPLSISNLVEGDPVILGQLNNCPWADCSAEIQQFTGLLDKDGIEIYEGDEISFFVHGAAHGREREEYKNQEVYYDVDTASFLIGKNYTKTGDRWGHSFSDEIDWKTVEVVGSVFKKEY
jgi:hypothetical protein